MFKRMMWLVGPVLLLVLALGALACGGSDASDSDVDETGSASVAEHQDEEDGHDEGDDGDDDADDGDHDSGMGDMAHVVLTEWSITGDGEELSTIPSGDVTIEAHNDGTAVHQFAIWQGGEVVGDGVEGGTLVAETDFIEPGGVAFLEVDIEPGEYILTCPVQGHTERGMHTEVAVLVTAE